MSLKVLKKNFLIDIATRLFLERGIEDVTIKDIADAAEVGEMTIYRYFSKKQNIVFESVISLQESVLKDYFQLDKGKTGFEKLSIFYYSYLLVFKERPNYFRFIREFDLLMIKDADADLQKYEDGLAFFKKAYFDAYELGLKDKSVRPADGLELFYYTSTHALIELCKKLSHEKGVLQQDALINKVDEIDCLIKTILAVFKNS